MAEIGTRLAHIDGGKFNIRVVLPELNEFYLGQLLYFLKRHAVSADMYWGSTLSTNPVLRLIRRTCLPCSKPGSEETKLSENVLINLGRHKTQKGCHSCGSLFYLQYVSCNGNINWYT